MTKVERVLSWDGNSRTGPNLNWGCLILLVKVVFRIHLIHANEMLTRLKKNDMCKHFIGSGNYPYFDISNEL